MAFGDSTTDENFNQKRIEYQEYYLDLKVYLNFLEEDLSWQKGFKRDFVNAGVSGDSSEDGRRRFERDVLGLQPALVLIQFGCNDQHIRQDLRESQPRVTVSRYKENLIFFIREIQKEGGKVILMTPGILCWNEIFRGYYLGPPYDLKDKAADGNLKQYVKVMDDLSIQFGLPLVDVYRAQLAYIMDQSHREILPDGLHPNTKGHEMIASLILPILKATIQS